MCFSHIAHFVTSKVTKHLSPWWLGLEIAVECSFLSNQSHQFDNWSLSNVVSISLAMLLHREEPLIHVLQPQLEKFSKNILAKFVKPTVMAGGLKKDDS